MNKNAIQRFAIWARKEMIAQVSQRAFQYGITETGHGGYDDDTVSGRVLSGEEKQQRRGIIDEIDRKGYAQVMEEVAYTWFNRFIALRFMEVNNYLPTHIRVFSDASGAFKPEILTNAIHLELPGLDMEKVSDLIEKNQSEDLYRYLLLTQCNALSEALPRMFERMGSYTELLLPNNILRQDGIIGHLVADIPEEDWTDQVQIIGWLYQYYNTELKDDTFALLKKNVKITKERIPSATQLFTPDWIVRYMVENSLGRLWLEGHPDEELKAGWKYYLEEAEQEPEVQAQLEAIRAEYRALRPQDIRIIDPCMGSGHILAYAFDVLVQIYKKAGFSERDAARSILENNLYGLDIDKRAAQLAYFSVMMKAREYDRRILTKGIQPQVYGPGLDPEVQEYGSLMQGSCATETTRNGQFSMMDESDAYKRLLAQKYDVVVTNPPYMGSGNMNDKLLNYVKKYYPDSKSDLSTVFMEKTLSLCNHIGYMAMINIPVWMFLSSFEKLREKLISGATFVSMVHPGRGIFGSDFGTTTFIIGKTHVKNYIGQYRRLFDKQGEVETIEQREKRFFEGRGKFTAKQSDFSKIPGSPVAYWVSERLNNTFTQTAVKDFGFAGIGMRTGDNNRFLRLWFEVSINRMLIGCKSKEEQISSKAKWIPYNKGGDFRRWYGNNEYVVNWENDGFAIKENTRKIYPYLGDNLGWKISNESFYYKPGITWSGVTSGKFGCRCYDNGFIFDSGANGLFTFNPEDRYYVAGALNSKFSQIVLDIINPTINTGSGTVGKIPIIISDVYKQIVTQIVSQSVALSRADWDSFETSWDFQRHPLVRGLSTVQESFDDWAAECEERFKQLKANEEELNRIFIDIYGLQDELTPEVEDKDVTVRRADLGRDIRSLISYAVGCMFGRYSLDKPGLIYAGGEWSQVYRKDRIVDENGRPITLGGFTLAAGDEYTYVLDNDHWIELSFSPDKDNIIPICDDDYFDDDITGRFIKWVEVVFGKETLEENLKYIADALGGKGTPREVIRSYFLNDFYADHLKIYQKRPIYWLFDSGKKNGFKALIYMHRYQSDLLARMRTDYVHEQQERYRTQLKHIGDAMDSASASERLKLARQQQKLQEQALELSKYEEKVHHLADQNIKIDLDDGVKHNYALFEDVLAKIK